MLDEQERHKRRLKFFRMQGDIGRRERRNSYLMAFAVIGLLLVLIMGT